jgi:hypothetical protein
MRLVIPDTLLCGYHAYYMCTYLLLQTIQNEFLTAHFPVQDVSGRSRHLTLWISSLLYVHILVIADNTKGFFDCPFCCPTCLWSFQTHLDSDSTHFQSLWASYIFVFPSKKDGSKNQGKKTKGVKKK